MAVLSDVVVYSKESDQVSGDGPEGRRTNFGTDGGRFDAKNCAKLPYFDGERRDGASLSKGNYGGDRNLDFGRIREERDERFKGYHVFDADGKEASDDDWEVN